MICLINFFFLSFVLVNNLVKTQNDPVATPVVKFSKEQRLAITTTEYNNLNPKGNRIIKLKKLKYPNNVRNTRETKTKVLRKRQIDLEVPTPKRNPLLELISQKDGISQLSDLFRGRNEKFIATCYNGGLLKKNSNCQRFTASNEICDIPLDFNENSMFYDPIVTPLQCVVNNVPRNIIDATNYLVIESGEDFEFIIRNETLNLRTSVLFTLDDCTKIDKNISGDILFKHPDGNVGYPIISKGAVIGMYLKHVYTTENATEGLYNVCSCAMDDLSPMSSRCEKYNNHDTKVFTIRIIKQITKIKKIHSGQIFKMNSNNYKTPYPISNLYLLPENTNYKCNQLARGKYNTRINNFNKNFVVDIHLSQIVKKYPAGLDVSDEFLEPGVYNYCYVAYDGIAPYSAKLLTISIDEGK
ncbi:hypothetical protein HEP_00184000 [Hepatocystis sp. ex Piliocolobus tephrosceles]|nr:hypothetical protein HEP_00184000 [Hepatocystis sp. ex Piliocolobus tephrosceles]